MSDEKAPFDTRRIRESWEPLDWHSPQEISGEALRYADYYGIRFVDDFPGLHHGFGYFEAAGHTIAVHAWLPERPRGTVLVVHGYFDHVGLYRHVIRHLLELDYAVLAWDLPGHGLSSGARAAIDDFIIYRQVLHSCLENKANAFPKPWHVVAQSTGAAIVMDYLVGMGFDEDSSPFDRVILLAPLVRPAAWRKILLWHWLVAPFRRYLDRRFTYSSGDMEFLNFLWKLDPLQTHKLSSRWLGALKKWVPAFERAASVRISPVVIQGDRDETVDWHHNLDIIRSKFRNPEIHLLEGARHQLVNESQDYRDQINAILDRYLA